MTINPLSLRRQLFFEFDDVADVRFEYAGYTTVFRALLRNGASGHTNPQLSNFIDTHRGAGCWVVLAEWCSGPSWPEFFDSLTSEQRELAEACNGTKSGIEGTVVQAFSDILAADCETVEGGWIRLTVQGKVALSSGAIAQIRNFTLACVASPEVRVDVVQGPVAAEPNPDFSIPLLIHQSSRSGLLDPILMAKADADEDLFRQIRSRGFVDTSEDLLLPDLRDKRAVYLPRSSQHLDLSSFLPLYDVVYIPVDPLLPESKTSFGVERSELLQLITDRRVIPVATNRLGEYPQKELRELVDAGYCVTPRRLAGATASQMLNANPLWRIASADESLAKAFLLDFRNHVLAEPDVDSDLLTIVNNWVSFQRDGCLHFLAGAISQSALLPLSFGPGAFIANLLKNKLGEKAPDVEAMYLGLDVSHAMALHSTIVPHPQPQLYPLYELLTLYGHARPVEGNETPFATISVVAQLDKILDDLVIRRPTGMPMSEWLSATEPLVVDLRATLDNLFAGKTATLDDVRRQAELLRKHLETIDAARTRTAAQVERFEVVGIISDVIAWGMDWSFPCAGTAIGAVMKRAFPYAWRKLDENRLGVRCKEVLEGMNAFVPPNVVRLHRLRAQLPGNSIVQTAQSGG